MNTLRSFTSPAASIPASTAWYLGDLGEFRGKQELYTRQSPQRLKVLREHAIIESALASNRIEGVDVEPSRIQAVLATAKPLFRDRDEEEVRGYRDALAWIHEKAAGIPFDETTIKRLHAMTRGQIWDAGQYKEKDGDIIERYADGHERVRFRTVTAKETPQRMEQLLADWHLCLKERWVHPLVALIAFNLDFLCIHPFRDGNGRVSRLLLLLQCYQLGYEVGRYVSLERLIEQNKERYYETLELSSKGWHERKQDPWPFVNYMMSILKDAYREFVERVGQTTEPKGAKAVLIREAVKKQTSGFRLADIESACPGVGREWIRKVLGEMQAAGELKCEGRGLAARWSKKEGTA